MFRIDNYFFISKKALGIRLFRSTTSKPLTSTLHTQHGTRGQNECLRCGEHINCLSCYFNYFLGSWEYINYILGLHRSISKQSSLITIFRNLLLFLSDKPYAYQIAQCSFQMDIWYYHRQYQNNPTKYSIEPLFETVHK